MVDITEASMKGGIADCLMATVDPDNLPTYVGLGGGLIAGNAVGKKLQSYYDNSVEAGVDPNRWIQLGIRTIGRLTTSGLLCSVSGSFDDKAKEGMQMAAIGSTGFIIIDVIRELGRDPAEAEPSWIDDYLTLQVPTRRAVRRNVNRAAPRMMPLGTPRPVALQRPAMESAALQPEGALIRTASLRV